MVLSASVEPSCPDGLDNRCGDTKQYFSHGPDYWGTKTCLRAFPSIARSPPGAGLMSLFCYWRIKNRGVVFFISTSQKRAWLRASPHLFLVPSASQQVPGFVMSLSSFLPLVLPLLNLAAGPTPSWVSSFFCSSCTYISACVVTRRWVYWSLTLRRELYYLACIFRYKGCVMSVPRPLPPSFSHYFKKNK